jgi:hypothetical protein
MEEFVEELFKININLTEIDVNLFNVMVFLKDNTKK